MKGRDWYDFAWYISHHPNLNILHLEQRMRNTGHFTNQESLTRDSLLALLNESIDNVDIDAARKEVLAFIKETRDLDIWSKDFFRAAVNQIVVG